MRLGAASMMRCTTFLERPARGGSTITRSGRPARSTSSGSAVRVSPAKKRTFLISFLRAPAIASATAGSISSIPHTSPARCASVRAIVPIPEYRSYTRSQPPSAAYSSAMPYRSSAISVFV